LIRPVDMLDEAVKNGAGEFAQKLARARPGEAGLVVVKT
jgi:hypothetical protein